MDSPRSIQWQVDCNLAAQHRRFGIRRVFAKDEYYWSMFNEAFACVQRVDEAAPEGWQRCLQKGGIVHSNRLHGCGNQCGDLCRGGFVRTQGSNEVKVPAVCYCSAGGINMLQIGALPHKADDVIDALPFVNPEPLCDQKETSPTSSCIYGFMEEGFGHGGA